VGIYHGTSAPMEEKFVWPPRKTLISNSMHETMRAIHLVGLVFIDFIRCSVYYAQ
jgi:hypothetical protein